MFEWLFGLLGLGRKKRLDVTTGVRYDETRETFLVGYSSRRNRFDNVGVGSSMKLALEDLSDAISSLGWTSRDVRRKLDKANECSLSLNVYHTSNDRYVVELMDENEGSVSGRGRNMNSAVSDLASKVND